MKPVTELYEEAEGWAQGVSDAHGEDGLLRAVGAIDRLAGSAGTPALLEVLDLVATSNRLGLVRWVVGLSDADRMTMLGALSLYAHKYSLGEEQVRASRLYEALRLQSAALTGGEGEAKCPECHGAGKVKRLEGGGSIRLVKYDPCPKCAEGEGGAKKKPNPTMLPAGKPPPFLRVGMVLKEPTTNRLWTIQEVWQVGSARCTCPDSFGGWWSCDVLRTWPLAEPFTVEGES